MAKFKKADFRPASEWIDKLPKAQREKAEKGAAEIVHALGDLHPDERKPAPLHCQDSRKRAL